MKKSNLKEKEKNEDYNLIKEKKRKGNLKKKILLIIGIIVLLIVSFIIYEVATFKKTYYINEKNINIPIFIYHDIVKDKSEIEYDYMETTSDIFEKQITGLINLGYTPISYQDLIDYKKGEKPISKHSFLITFDDGFEGVYKYAYPIALKYNIPMCTFIINDCMELPNYLSCDQIKEMNDSNIFQVYMHGLKHIEYDKVDKNQLLDDTNNAYKQLKYIIKKDDILKVFAYPYGLYTLEESDYLGSEGYIQNLADNKVNQSKTLNLNQLHRCYPLSDPIWKILLKIEYRSLRYADK